MKALDARKADDIRAKIIKCEKQDLEIRHLKSTYEDKMRELYLYRGNGDLKD